MSIWVSGKAVKGLISLIKRLKERGERKTGLSRLETALINVTFKMTQSPIKEIANGIGIFHSKYLVRHAKTATLKMFKE